MQEVVDRHGSRAPALTPHASYPLPERSEVERLLAAARRQISVIAVGCIIGLILGVGYLATAWIAEGLLVYLPPEAQDRLFDNITALSAPGSRLATEHMDMANMPEDWAEKLDERSRRAGTDLNLSELFYSGERNTAGDYLSSHGWQVATHSTAETFAANGFELPDDELTTLIGDSGYLTATLQEA